MYDVYSLIYGILKANNQCDSTSPSPFHLDTSDASTPHRLRCSAAHIHRNSSSQPPPVVLASAASPRRIRRLGFMARGSRSELARRQQRDAKGKFSGPVLGRCQKPSSAAGGSSRTKTPKPSLAIGGSSRSMKVPPGFGPAVTSNPNASSAVGGRTRSKTLKATPVLGASPPSQRAVDFPLRFGASGSRNPKASALAGGHARGSQRQLTCPKQNIDKVISPHPISVFF